MGLASYRDLICRTLELELMGLKLVTKLGSVRVELVEYLRGLESHQRISMDSWVFLKQFMTRT